MPDTVSHLPSYTGITNVNRVGLTVNECARRVGRFGFVSQQLMRLQAAKMSSVANWEFKAMLGRQLWECAQHWGEWFTRAKELRGHDHLIDGHAHGKLADVFEECSCRKSIWQLYLKVYRFNHGV